MNATERHNTATVPRSNSRSSGGTPSHLSLVDNAPNLTSQEFYAKLARYRGMLSDKGRTQSALHQLMMRFGYEVPPIEFWNFKQMAIFFGALSLIATHIVFALLVGALSTHFFEGVLFTFEVSLKTGSFLIACAVGPAVAWHIANVNRRLRLPKWSDI
jgi:hypothetical protein